MTTTEKVRQLLDRESLGLLVVHDQPVVADAFAMWLQKIFPNMRWANIVTADEYENIDEIILNEYADIALVGNFLRFYPAHAAHQRSGQSVLREIKSLRPDTFTILISEVAIDPVEGVDVQCDSSCTYKDFMAKFE